MSREPRTEAGRTLLNWIIRVAVHDQDTPIREAQARLDILAIEDEAASPVPAPDNARTVLRPGQAVGWAGPVPVPAPTLDVERLRAAIETLAHGHCCWDADLDSRDLAAAYIALATPDTETA